MENPKKNKELGRWGEELLDFWLVSKGWKIAQKNLRIFKGEIDRIYAHYNQEREEKQYCLAEVKTFFCRNPQDLNQLSTEVGIKRFIKARQIRNLYYHGQTYHTKIMTREHMKSRVFIRLFIVLKFSNHQGQKWLESFPKSPSLKLCFTSDDCAIFSIEPEFSTIQARKSLLEIKI